MIKDVLVPELEKRFGLGSFRTGESPIVVFPAEQPDVGDVQIWDEDDDLINNLQKDTVYFVWSGPHDAETLGVAFAGCSAAIQGGIIRVRGFPAENRARIAVRLPGP